MKRIIALVAAVGMISFVSSCSSCTISGTCDASGTAAVKAVNDATDVVVAGISSKKTACDVLTAWQTWYGSACKIAWQ